MIPDEYLTPWLDGRVPESQTPTRLLASGRNDVEVTFVELVDEQTGRVLYPADSTNEVAASLSPGVYVAGAVCPAVLGSDGRVAMVYPPMDLGEGDRTIVGEWTKELETLRPSLENLHTDLEEARTELNEQMEHLQEELDAKDQAISDAAASLVTNDRLVAGSLSTWPFVGGTVPSGALADGSVGSAEIADFAITARKLKSTRHVLY